MTTYSLKSQVSISRKPPRPLADMCYPKISKGTTFQAHQWDRWGGKKEIYFIPVMYPLGQSVTFNLWISTGPAFKYCRFLLTLFSEYMDFAHHLLCWQDKSPIFILSGLCVMEISSEMSSMCHATTECVLKGHVISHHLRAPVWPVTSQTGIMTSNNNTVWGSDPKRQSSWHACHFGLRDFIAVCDRTEICWNTKHYGWKLFQNAVEIRVLSPKNNKLTPWRTINFFFY